MRQALGRAAELFVEQWFEQQGWLCFERNMRVPGGEIDRLFVRERCASGLRVDLCVVEVKATRIVGNVGFEEIFSSAKMRTLMKPNQLRTVWRSAAHYENRLKALTKTPVRTFVRYFLVVFAPPVRISQLKTKIQEADDVLSLRCCHASRTYLIVSWSPDVCPLAF